MLLAGRYSLGTISPITTAVSSQVLTSGFDANGAAVGYLDRLEGMTSATIEADFDYGTGTATGILLVQTRIGWTNWLDILRIDLAEASRLEIANLTAAALGVTSYAALSAEGVTNGVLGTQLRAVLTTTGTYAGNTALAVTATVR